MIKELARIIQSVYNVYINNQINVIIKNTLDFFSSVFENKERIILVLDCATEGELYDYINKRGKLTEKDARRIFRQIVAAVNYCHQVVRGGIWNLLDPVIIFLLCSHFLLIQSIFYKEK